MAPTVRFHTQPSGDGDNAGEYVRRLLTDPEIETFDVVVAWVRFRGLARLSAQRQDFSKRGRSGIIVGIDEGGGTRPGLIAALRSFSEAYVYHVRGGATFHPKVYLACGLSKAHLFVGSSNATPGGLFFNDEASLEAEFALPEEADEHALLGAAAYFDGLLADESVCLPLTDELIERLVADPRYRVSTRDRQARPKVEVPLPEGAEPDDADEALDGDPAAEPKEPIFGSSSRPRPGVANLSDEARAELADLEGDDIGAMPRASPGVAPPATSSTAPATPPSGASPPAQTVSPAAPTIVYEWSKEMSRADAQQPASSSTNPTGLLRLAQAGHDIDHRTWFRYTLFGGAAWAPSTDREGNDIEIATVPFNVTIGGVAQGTVNIVVDHAPHREEGQGNVLSILHRGPMLAPLLRATDYHDRTVTISYLSDGSFALKIV